MNFWSFKTIGRFANSDREFYFSVNCALIPIYSWQCIQRENDGSGLRKIATAVRDIGVAVARAELTNIHQYEYAVLPSDLHGFGSCRELRGKKTTAETQVYCVSLI